jgi:hypothetical protein
MPKKKVTGLEKTIVTAKVYKCTADLLKAFSKDTKRSLSDTINTILTNETFTVMAAMYHWEGAEVPEKLKQYLPEPKELDLITLDKLDIHKPDSKKLDTLKLDKKLLPPGK